MQRNWIPWDEGCNLGNRRNSSMFDLSNGDYSLHKNLNMLKTLTSCFQVLSVFNGESDPMGPSVRMRGISLKVGALQILREPQLKPAFDLLCFSFRRGRRKEPKESRVDFRDSGVNKQNRNKMEQKSRLYPHTPHRSSTRTQGTLRKNGTK